ncbi:site-specific DNA-methyltransferase [Marinilactibacillus piezotolerans]|uniref:site-specific DNA-methyltransferase n=1 Tax=Marinilactibacillus piezotolerans TaxID=258723 RepID=UPI0021173B33|nr:site-specific DNA-methyltransferase [Marinilactibacillus piezotolerans]
MNSTIETTLLNNIKTVLSDFPEYWDEETLLKNRVIEDLRNYDEKVITALLSNDKIKEAYALSVGDMTIFKVEEFIEMLRYKTYWENSYTKYRNEIGLTSDGKYLNYNTDVVLDFPFKDCVLEGGMSNEDEDKKEVYYHNVIAKEEIDTLFSPKVLTNMNKYDKDGEREVTEFNDNDNLIIKGNNLLALHTLKERYAGKVKLIYIDPPYNTNNDGFNYNDSFNHSTWLTFMKNRLEIAKELLAESGSIWINIDSNESHYLNVILDSIFNRNNFIADIVWNHTKQSKNDERFFSRHYNHLIVYSKNKDLLDNFEAPRTKKDNINYKNPDNDPKGLWRSGDVRSPNLRETLKYNIIAPDNSIISPPDNGWRWSEKTVKEKISTGEIIFKADNSGIIRKIYLSDQSGRTPENIWLNSGTTREANKELKGLFGKAVFSTPKPEGLLKTVIELATNENDLLLDFFMGSATTQAVAMKMNRKFIGIEQMDYINTVSVHRLQKVIEGEQGGISKEVDWRGGGSFVYAELDSLNQHYIDKLNEIASEEQLETILEEMMSSAYLNFKVELNKVTVEDDHFSTLSIDEKKKVLIDVLDMNQLYLNYSEIDDTQYDISEEVKQFNHSFYGQGGE